MLNLATTSNTPSVEALSDNNGDEASLVLSTLGSGLYGLIVPVKNEQQVGLAKKVASVIAKHFLITDIFVKSDVFLSIDRSYIRLKLDVLKRECESSTRGDSTQPIPPAVYNFIESLLLDINTPTIPPKIVPADDGSVALLWESDGVTLFIDIDAQERIHYYFKIAQFNPEEDVLEPPVSLNTLLDKVQPAFSVLNRAIKLSYWKPRRASIYMYK